MSQTVTAPEPGYAVGSLVRARGRDWVVLSDSDATCLVLRPLGGGEDDIAAVLPAHEDVRPATFAPPSPEDLGDDRSARLLRDALRIGFRSTGGPFRCLAGLSVSPRPYQLVPLLLALRQETVRLLIADDVGIGKTVEAGLVAAELLAQGSATGLTVLCPPSLATQWQQELSEKFGLDAQLVLPGTVRHLERGLAGDESIFTRHPITVISTDFIKSDRRRHEFLRAAPDLVIVDEAHGSVNDDSGRGSSGRTQRYRLLRDLADDTTRHLLLVTATPHSGNEGAFRNLIGLLDPALATVNLSTEEGRRALAQHLVQRRRADIRHYLQQDTKFPDDRQVQERAYQLSPAHREIFDDVLGYVRGQVQDTSGTKLEQRVRWWSALSLLRSIASSPAAARATLATRSASASAESPKVADELGRSEVLDLAEDAALDSADAAPGAVAEADATTRTRRVLKQLEQRAADLESDPASDAKLNLLVADLKKLLKGDASRAEGYHPLVFCRFIQTAHYVTAALRKAFPKVAVEVVTGELAADERSARVSELVARAEGGPKILVATDCLSEGVNLQEDFQAVVHYDLAWNPTRHEQREGRVDRFGQPSNVVRALLLYGEDNGIDGIILDVLLRKHESIRKDLGISVAVPPQSDQVLAALLEGVLMRGASSDQLTLDLGVLPQAKELDDEWRSSAEEERRSRSRFAQATIHADDVQAAMDAARHAMGEPSDIREFVLGAFAELGADIVSTSNAGAVVDIANTPIGVRDALRTKGTVITLANDLPAPRGVAVLQRTDPLVTGLARFVLDGALDPQLPETLRPARRCGMISTRAVNQMTTALLLRMRTHVTLPGRELDGTHVAEEAKVVAFRGSPTNPMWLTDEEVIDLMAATPDANVQPDVAVNAMRAVLAALPTLQPNLDEAAADVAKQLQKDHVIVRTAARGDRVGRLGTHGLDVQPELPPDILGVYVFRPIGGVA